MFAEESFRKKRCYFFDRSGSSMPARSAKPKYMAGTCFFYCGTVQACTRGCCIYGDSCSFKHSSQSEAKAAPRLKVLSTIWVVV